MPRKVRELVQDLTAAGFHEISGGGKGSHRKFTHRGYSGAVTLSGRAGDDAKPYQAREPGDRGGAEMKPSDGYHKWVEWSTEDGTYIGMCPDVITGIHGGDPIRLYAELCEVIDDVIAHLQSEGRPLPLPRTRPMQEVV